MMKEFLFFFKGGNYYLSTLKNSAEFGSEENVCLKFEPHEFEIKVSGETLNKSSSKGYIVEISKTGAAHFYDYSETPIDVLEGTDKSFAEFKVDWSDTSLKISFGHTETVDNYPNCDGEHDRWSEKWANEYAVVLDIATNKAEAIQK